MWRPCAPKGSGLGAPTGGAGRCPVPGLTRGAQRPPHRDRRPVRAERSPPRLVFVTLTGKGGTFGKSVIKRTLSESVVVCQALEESELPSLGDRAWAPDPGRLPVLSVPSWIPGRGAPPPSLTPRGKESAESPLPCREVTKRPPWDFGRLSAQDGPIRELALSVRLLGAPTAVPSPDAHQVREEPPSAGEWANQGCPPLGWKQQAEGQMGEGLPRNGLSSPGGGPRTWLPCRPDSGRVLPSALCTAPRAGLSGTEEAARVPHLQSQRPS